MYSIYSEGASDVKLSAGSWTSLVYRFVSASRGSAIDVQTSLQATTLVTFYNYVFC
jgi:hypothetical protein